MVGLEGFDRDVHGNATVGIVSEGVAVAVCAIAHQSMARRQGRGGKAGHATNKENTQTVSACLVRFTSKWATYRTVGGRGVTLTVGAIIGLVRHQTHKLNERLRSGVLQWPSR